MIKSLFCDWTWCVFDMNYGGKMFNGAEGYIEKHGLMQMDR